MTNQVEDIVDGLCLIADVYSPNTPAAVESIASTALGFNEKAIRAALQYTVIQKYEGDFIDYKAVNNEVDSKYLHVIERCKTYLRMSALVISNENDEARRITNHVNRIARMRALSKQHHTGTTVEIAEFLKVSKRKVRQYKAEGTLDAMIELAKAEQSSKQVSAT